MTDVFLVRQPLDPEKLEEAREFFTSIDDDPSRVMDVLEAETVYTESAFLEEGEDGPAVLYYIEARDGATVEDVFQDVMAEPESMSEEIAELARSFEAVVDGEPERLDVELLYHLVNPERPRRE